MMVVKVGCIDCADGIGTGGRYPLLAMLAFCLVMAMLTPAASQVHHLEEIPWHVLDNDSRRRGVEMTWQQYREPQSRWHVERLGLTILAPVGARGFLFLREDYIRFDTAGFSALERWPHLRPAIPVDPDEAGPEWPYETIINDFARPEFGLVFPWRMPLVGEGHLGLRAGVPIGTDRLYPMSASCLPISVDWRVARGVSRALNVAARIGFEHTFASSGDDLEGGAFPSGMRYGCELGGPHDRNRGVNLAWSARELDGGRHVRRLALSGWLPVGQDHILRLQVARDLGLQVDRLATWVVGLTWHLAVFQQDDEQKETPARQNANDAPFADQP